MNTHDTWVRIPRTFLSDRVVTDGPPEIAGYRVALHLIASDNGSCRTDDDGKPIYEDVIVESDYIHPEAIRCDLPRAVTLEQCVACHEHLVAHGEIELLEVDEQGRGLWSVRRVALLNKVRLKDRERKKSARELARLEKHAAAIARGAERPAETQPLFPDGQLQPSADRPWTVSGQPKTGPRGTASGAGTGRHTHAHTTSRVGRSASGARARPGGRAHTAPTGRDLYEHYYAGAEISSSTNDDRTEAYELAQLYEALASSHDVTVDVECLADGFVRLLTTGAELVDEKGDPSVSARELEHAIVALWTTYQPRGNFDLRDALVTGAAFPRLWRRIDAGPELLRLDAALPDAVLPEYFDTVVRGLFLMAHRDTLPDEATLERVALFPAWARREAGRRFNVQRMEITQ